MPNVLSNSVDGQHALGAFDFIEEACLDPPRRSLEATRSLWSSVAGSS